MATTLSFTERIALFARQRCLIDEEQHIRIGFSGGADSTALTLVLAASFPHIEAVHLNHELRGDQARADQAWCEAFCRERRIPYTQAHLDVAANRRRGEGLEAAGRRLRLAYWKTTSIPNSVVALGHHADDCLEDMLLRLARGAGAGGLTSMRPWRDIAGIRFVRPLLDCRREEIEQFLTAEGTHDWRRDESNEDPAFRRNAIRHRWLPLIRQTVGHDLGLLRSLEALRDDADCLQQLACQSIDAIHDLERLRCLPTALLLRVLRLWLQRQTGADVVVPRAAILRVRSALDHFGGNPLLLPIVGTIVLRLDAGGLHLVREQCPLLARTWSWRRQQVLDLPEAGMRLEAVSIDALSANDLTSGADSEFFAPESLAETLEVRPWRHGYRMVPFGHHSETKLQDLFCDKKIPREKRYGFPVILSAGEIIWVPGLRRGEHGRLALGRRAIRLRYRMMESVSEPTEEEDDVDFTPKTDAS